MTAYKLIAKEKSIENVISAIKALNEKNLKKNKKEKYHMPAKFEFQNARELFKNAKTETLDNARLKWSDPDKEGLVNFLTNGKGFSSSRVLNGLTKI